MRSELFIDASNRGGMCLVISQSGEGVILVRVHVRNPTHQSFSNEKSISISMKDEGIIVCMRQGTLGRMPHDGELGFCVCRLVE